MNRPSTPDIEAVEMQAERWFVRMRSDRRQPVDEFMFRQWLAADPAHEQAYQTLAALWADLADFAEHDALRDLRHLALHQAGLTPPGQAAAPPPLLREPVRQQRRRRRYVPMAAALAAVALVGLLWIVNPTLYQARYETGIGARHSLRLLDGTRITLNTDTALAVRYDLRSRQVQLEGGQAHFQVSRSRWWPFQVDAGSGGVRALGTAFDVYRRDGDVRVTLVEGRVQVYGAADAPSAALVADDAASTVLAPGEQILVSPQGLSAVSTVSMPKATAWLSGRLVFDDERLRDVITEVNRYSPTRLVIEDPALAEVRVSGVFRAGRAEGFVTTLRASFPVETSRRDDGSLLLSPGADVPLPERISAPSADPALG